MGPPISDEDPSPILQGFFLGGRIENENYMNPLIYDDPSPMLEDAILSIHVGQALTVGYTCFSSR